MTDNNIFGQPREPEPATPPEKSVPDAQNEAVTKAVNDLEKELALPKGFFNTLAHEDDWSFVIKLHALFESSLGYVVGHKLGDEVMEVVARLDMNGARGKVAFARALDLVTPNEVRFLELLSRLRNRCAHGIRQAVEFSLPTYVAGLARDERREFLRAIRGDDPDRPFEIGGASVSHQQFVLDNPKTQIWLTSMWVLAGLYMLKEIEDFVRRKQKALIEHALDRTPQRPNPLLIAMGIVPADKE
ncbi:hypothetical protein [Paraburkholderia strydomiana]|uniref:hypothetical protein n=1 Tax=Paraburkholderia strydomiana TaxID=1245417 RepID=UPI001BEA19B9|nr:hypothetical protein [Paraburkholderia strydomiana]MBT2791217.1 hypothetical protein [Paraburkholderia strydomiana]